MANKHVRRCSTHQEMQIKNIIRHHCILSRMAKTKKTVNTVGEDKDPHTLLMKSSLL